MSMIKNIWLWAAVILGLQLMYGCGGVITDSELKTYHGYRVAMEPRAYEIVHMSDVETVIDETVIQFSIATGHSERKIRRKMKGLAIKFFDNYLSCNAWYEREDGTLVESEKCAGLYHNPHPLIEVWAREFEGSRFCLSWTALSHELVHFMADKVEGDSNHFHDDPRLFNDRNSAEVMGKMQSAELVCPWLFAEFE